MTMPRVVYEGDAAKTEGQIKALEGLLTTDNPKDREIHIQAIKDLQQHLEEMKKC